MSLKLIANYSKRLGLPGYSSHQFSVSVETEITNINELENESSRLYLTLQKSVDQEIQHTGFVPGEGYGQQSSKNAEWPVLQRNNGTTQQQEWKCSDKQRDLIFKIIAENGVDRGDVESIALELFSTSSLPELNKLQCSGLIDELLSRYGKKPSRGTTPIGRFNGKSPR